MAKPTITYKGIKAKEAMPLQNRSSESNEVVWTGHADIDGYRMEKEISMCVYEDSVQFWLFESEVPYDRRYREISRGTPLKVTKEQAKEIVTAFAKVLNLKG